MSLIIFALTECPKYLTMEVNHNSCNHNCQLTTLPWQVGPHELFHLHGTINGRRFCILVDDGATHNFLNYTLVKKLHLQQESNKHKYVVSLINENDKDVCDTIAKGIMLEMQNYTMTMDFQVMNMTPVDVNWAGNGYMVWVQLFLVAMCTISFFLGIVQVHIFC